MPIVEVKIYDRRVTEESVPKIIDAMTDALAESSGAAREHIQVLVHGITPQHWGIAGEPQQ
jgi:4-oxalocrotonate tautomerase